MTPLASFPRIALGLLSLAFVCVVSPARAADEPKKEKGPSKAELKQYDTNGDGKLDETETTQMKAAFAARFKQALGKYDANHNGKLDDDEVAKLKEDERLAAKTEQQAGKNEAQTEKRRQNAQKKASKGNKN